MKTKYRFTITYESVVDTETGEILETKIVDKTEVKDKPVKKVKKDESPEPKVTLDPNKLILTSAAVALMGLSADDKVDIKYENSIPVIGSDSAFGTKGGCKLTKSNTVAYRGAKNAELAKYGNEFDVVPHPNKNGLFILKSDAVNIEKLNGDENVHIDQEDENPFDLDLTEFVDDKDANITEIDASFFKL